MDSIRERAINDLRYGNSAGLAMGQMQAAKSAQAPRMPSDDEIAEMQAAQRRYAILDNRRQALSAAVALGRRYDSVEEALDDSRKLAAFLGLEIE